MSLIVMKFGGDALGDKGKGAEKAEGELLRGPTFNGAKFRHVATIVRRAHEQGHKVVLVASAMGDTTNRLIAMAKELSPRPHARELDMLMATGEQQAVALLAIAIREQGLAAQSFTGPQVGIVTEAVFGKARITAMNVDRLRRSLDEGAIAVIAGFQGATDEGDFTTLGRGGSDITAVAVAAALGADICEFYKDVDGVYTTDPRVCSGARHVSRITYDEMLELASMGAGVLHSRSIEFAKNYGVPLLVRNYTRDVPGTYIVPKDPSMEDVVVSGVAFNREEAKITILGLPDRPGMAAEVFQTIGSAHIAVDMIIQNAASDGRNDISFTVARGEYDEAMRVARELCARLGARDVTGDRTIAKVSIVGVGIRSHTGVPGRMFQSLASAGINIQMISTSEIKLSCVIAEKDMENAVRALHREFVGA
jgi:aspartate kinase